jgi:hypothetical protein
VNRLKGKLAKVKAQQLVKEYLGWSSLKDCEGFWLNKNIYLVADSSQVVMVKRQRLDGEKQTGPLPMLILNNVAEMTINKDNKIVSVKTKDAIGLWLDSLKKTLPKP